MFDLLDILKGKPNLTFTGTHYKTQPEMPDDEHYDFDYEFVDPAEWRFQKLFSNLINNDKATVTIKTNDGDYKIGEFVALQDGGLYKIMNVLKDYQSGSREVYRFLKDAPQVDYILRLVEVSNAWQL